jgi:Molybdopterin-binding domain of aldehyde dehydrogenase
MEYVATCAEVEIEQVTKQVRIRRVVQAWESGAIVNANGLNNQITGAIVQGMAVPCSSPSDRERPHPESTFRPSIAYPASARRHRMMLF